MGGQKLEAQSQTAKAGTNKESGICMIHVKA
jgi:hypothetical protein